MQFVDLVFTGRVLPGADPNRAIEELIRLTGLNSDTARAAIARGLTRLTMRGLTADHGRTWLARAAAIGLEARLSPSSSPEDYAFVSSAEKAPSPPSSRTPPPKPGALFANSLGMEFVLIPAGRFPMGSSEEEEGAYDDEQPQHMVWISRPFYLGKHPVTQAQWEAVMGSNPSEFRGADRPVEMVSWAAAHEFIEKLNAREARRGYRLPTEAEWEYACRAGSTAAYCFGDDAGELEDYAWWRDNSGEETHPVGLKRPNAWGLHDMHGNVWEWVQDWYGRYDANPATNPQGPETGEYRVLRGGSWSRSSRLCRSAFRIYNHPESRRESGINAGLRLAFFPRH